jgi:hypothetical protein
VRSVSRRSNSLSLTALAAVIALLLLSSCVPAFSVHPFFTEKDLTFDRALLGTWIDPTEKNARGGLVIEEMSINGRPAYSFTMEVTDKPAMPKLTEGYDGSLFVLGGQKFLDVIESGLHSGDEAVTVLAMPAHMIAKVSLEGDSLKLSFLDDEWLKKNLEDGTIPLRHEIEADTPLLTAETADLQKFVLNHMADEKAFSFEVGPLQRKK